MTLVNFHLIYLKSSKIYLLCKSNFTVTVIYLAVIHFIIHLIISSFISHQNTWWLDPPNWTITVFTWTIPWCGDDQVDPRRMLWTFSHFYLSPGSKILPLQSSDITCYILPLWINSIGHKHGSLHAMPTHLYIYLYLDIIGLHYSSLLDW